MIPGDNTVGRPSHLDQPPRGYPAGFKMSYAKLERRAASVRASILPDVGLLSALPALRVFERLEKYYVQLGAQRVALEHAVNVLRSGVEAMTLYDPGTGKIVLALSEETYENLERGQPRANQTFFHELGHAALHAKLLKRMGTMPHFKAALLRGPMPSHSHCEDTEWMADAFAAAIRAPAAGLHHLELAGLLDHPTVCNTFNISGEAARIRLEVYKKYKHELM